MSHTYSDTLLLAFFIEQSLSEDESDGDQPDQQTSVTLSKIQRAAVTPTETQRPVVASPILGNPTISSETNSLLTSYK